MYVCICNALKESQVRLVAGGLSSHHDLHPALGCQVRCGRCLPQIAGILAESNLDPAPTLTAGFSQAAE